MKTRILRKLENQSIMHVPSNVFGSSFLLFLLIAADISFLITSKLFLFGSILILLNNVFRYILYRSKKYNKLMLNSVIISAFGWMILIYSVGSNKGMNDLHSIIALVILSGVAASGSISNAYFPVLSRLYVFFSLVIPSTYIFFWDHSSWILSGVGYAYAGYLFRFCSQYYKDIYDLNLHQEKLELSEHTFKTMLDAIPGIVSLVGQDLTYKVINNNLESILGLESKEIIGKKIGFFNPDSSFISKLYEYVESNCQIPIYYRVQISDNNQVLRWYLLSMNRVIQSQDVICLSLNIDDLVKLELENEEQKNQLIQANKLSELGQIVSGIAHEINNPIAIIKGKLSQLVKLINQESLDRQKSISIIMSVDKTTDRINKIIQSILSFSRKANLEPLEKTSVDELIKDTLEFASIKNKKYDVTMIYENPVDEIYLNCRPIEVSQVILNLISNAADAIQSLQDRWIKLVIEQNEEQLSIRVSNSGPKIDENLAKKIMQPFFTTKESGKGTGLGLTISSQIMKNYGGSLSLDEKSEHTCFVLTFPKQTGDQLENKIFKNTA